MMMHKNPGNIALTHGVYCMILTFFDPETKRLDALSIAKHAIYLAKAGIVGIVTMASDGEAINLDNKERNLVINTIRKALDASGFNHIPVICGALGQRNDTTKAHCIQGGAAGASYALISAPKCYQREAAYDPEIEKYFMDMADASPIPIIVHSHPAPGPGIDMESDTIIRLSQHPNIIGTHFECDSVGKITRVARATNPVTAIAQGSGYMIFGGKADSMLQSAIAGCSGIISGSANVIPRTCIRVWKVWASGNIPKALDLQKVLSTGDWVIMRRGIPSIKAAMFIAEGYGGIPRPPLEPLGQQEVKEMKKEVYEVVGLEKSLSGSGNETSDA